ncbi:hypothetical protein [Bacillus sp. FJAT-22090]|uniref:hypothetical protein n=1 Tax=Bacillus sp. FJAT-22090 TaxID=1581038 RepID=UPI0011A7AB8B|nr:hypothetical protein [Bacillus sp. FJAT-22090]
MENEKMITDMLKQMTIAILEINKKFDTLDKKFDTLDKKVDTIQLEMNQRFDVIDHEFEQVDKRLDIVEKRLESVENTVINLGEMFEHTVKIQQESDEKLHKSIKYLTHKVTEHDKEIFNMNNKQ